MSVLVWPSRYVLKRTLTVTLIAAAISISISTGIRFFTGSQADTVTIAVRLTLPFVIAIPMGLWWFARLEKLDRSYRELLKKTNELARRASADPLTGLLNRRSFIEHFEAAQEHRIAGSFLIADVDYLKTINDTYGHLAGDDAIIATADALTLVLGPESLIGRIGGDEFCAFVPGPIDELAVVGERISDVATSEFRRRSKLSDAVVSVSIGVQPSDADMTFRDLIAQSDRKLYRWKQDRPGVVFRDAASSQHTAPRMVAGTR